MKKIKTQQEASPCLSYGFNLQSLQNLQILHIHPNQLINIIQNIAQKNKTLSISPLLKFKVIALAAYFHPVMSKQAQQLISEMMIPYDSFWKIDSNLTNLLEILNIFSLTNHANYKILKINHQPNIQPYTYQHALWVNAMITFAEGEFFTQTQNIAKSVQVQLVEKVRQFLGGLIKQKEKARKRAYEQENQTNSKGFYHDLDIQLAERGIATVDYFPTDYLPQLIQIWVDRTVELNSLLGNFVCKQKFGQFEYIRGPLMYAMEKGILAVFNNFQQISNQLLVSLKSLAEEFKITHNQKVIKAKAGFRMLGILSGAKQTKSKASIGQYVSHLKLAPKNILNDIPYFQNELNRQFINSLISQFANKMGYLCTSKLWKRIIRLRKKIVNVQEVNQSPSSLVNLLWNSFFTQEFKDEINLEINDLSNISNPLRQIYYLQKYREIVIGRTSIFFNSLPIFNIVKTQYSLGVLQKLIVCFQLDQCPLLISQTGCGKTTLVQYLAQLSSHKLYVYNMSSGTDVTDLIGGFKPIDCRVLLKELFYAFLEKFRQEVPNAQKNQAYLVNLTNYFIQGKIQILLKSLVQSIPKILPQIQASQSSINEWKDMMKKFSNILMNFDKIDSNLVFSFLEGNLIKAIKNGDWILIDQINLATNDVLQKIVPLVDGKSLMLYEKGDLHYIERHKDFRIVACMNPANDSGKKPLPPNLADKFTTIIMSEPSKLDIQTMNKELCPQLNQNQIASLYFEIKKIKTISLRNLSRALAYINKNKEIYGWNRSVYDGLMLGFGQKQLLKKYFNDSIPKCPAGSIQLSGFLLIQGPSKQNNNQIFHLTQTFKEHLKDFLRAIAGTQLPVLLQGPTSAGKTSMIRYVAQAVGYKCIRINNHEHTQIQQYIGNYFPDKSGRLVFRQGPLVQAVSEGHWLILDELNLAKTQILECLNRLLDDNRELFIPQQQKHIKPHKNFRIFATQNPSSYSGRKTLSRAFRNRFVSISFTDITTEDTMAILEARSPLLKDSKQLSVFVKKTLQSLTNYRQRQRVFEKDGLITIRNLLKWCQRPFISKQKFIMEGYAILAEKLRCQQQKKFVEKALLSGIKYSTKNIKEEYYEVVSHSFSEQKISETNIYVQMNHSFKRMAALTIKALNNKQPVLLVGQTGCGKTTLAQLLAALTHRPFYSINCHKHMQASDLLGSLRPCSNPNSHSQFQFVNGVVINAMLEGAILLIDEINTAQDSVLQRLNQVLECGLIGIERGQGWETVSAREGFCIIATMNPSGDYGKKQLSPALRNRFTEIWVQPITHPQYIVQAESDILKMINHKLALPQLVKHEVAYKIYSFLTYYNCQIAPKYNLHRKLLTMRDIGWICKFINECENFQTWQQKYFWSLTILAIQGVKYIMADNVEGSKLQKMKDDLMEYLKQQINVPSLWISQTTPENIINLLKDMNFPLLIRSDIPLEVLGIKTNAEIFFSPQTDLSDLLGQYRPHGNQFVWHDETLLKSVKEGGIVGLIDLNTAQQQVVEGINSLFDHRGSLFVVQLNQTFHKASNFKPIVVLRSQRGNGRKGLPNSFLNRFVKISLPSIKPQIKLKYLQQKYENFRNNYELRNLVEKLIINQTHIITEQLEFIIQFEKASLLNTALQLLKLNQYIESSYQKDQLDKYEQYILKLLPLKQSLYLNTPGLIKILLTAFLIYKFSSFSLCIVGKSETRSNLVHGLNYILNKNLIKIIISTMVDINDLLGTYEQIADDHKIQEEPTLKHKILRDEETNQYQSQKTKFVFVVSRLVRCLRDENNLIYVEVPNDTIAQRIQKGLRQVYNQQKKIILSIENINQKKNNITKFITIDLNQQPPKYTLPKINGYEYFPSNYTNLTHCDSIIRIKESKDLIIQLMNDENDTASVAAWRRLLGSLYSADETQSKNKEQIKQKIIKSMQSKYKVNLVQNQIAQERVEEIQRHTLLAHNREQMLEKISLLCFFTADPNQMNKKLTFIITDDQLALNEIIKKFQILYICDVNNFKQTSKTILPMLTKASSRDLLRKYYKQVERLYEQLFKFKIKQILIQFNQQQYKLIPVINNSESIRYFMSQDNLDVLRICDEGVHTHHILNGVEKVIVENVKLIEVSIPSVSRWCRQVKIKHVSSLSILQSHLNKKDQLLSSPLHQNQVIYFLKKLQIYDSLADRNQTQQGRMLWELFKPSDNMSINISYHLKIQSNFRYFKELISDDNLYLQKYIKFSQLKYFSYKPQELAKISQKIGQYKEQMLKIQKRLIYRGHDNLLNLIQFYKMLLQYTEKLERSHFDLEIIRSTIVQTYHTYYHLYSDVLLPYYLALQVIYVAKLNQGQTKKISIAQTISTNKQSVIALIETLIQVEEGETDRSKDYVKFQRKFNKTVIVDEYTEEGVEKNKQNLEEQFVELFGKHSQHQKPRVQSPFQTIHMLVHKTKQNYYPYLSKKIFNNCSSYEEMIWGLQILMKVPLNAVNIYQEYHPNIVIDLIKPITQILQQIYALLKLYPIDNIKNLANICNKIQQRSIYEQVYKILIDCQFLIEKIFQVNPILPMANHIATAQMIQNCLKVRKLQLKNWKQMMQLKLRRTQKSDMIEFLGFYKNLRAIQNEKQLFAICEAFLRESKISCINNRISLLLYLQRESVIPKDSNFRNALFRVVGFYNYLMPELTAVKNKSYKQKQEEMRDYEKLAGWNSNQYLIFKATCEKFQRKIHHILKRHDEELSMTVGTFHQKLKAEQIFGSIKDFKNGLLALIDSKIEAQAEQQENENQQNEAEASSEVEGIQDQNCDDYEKISKRIFSSLNQIQQEHHTTQSKLLIIRANLSQLEDLFHDFVLTSKVHYKYLTREMFETEQLYARGVKYYYGLWDKLCQRSQTKWNLEMVDRLWHVTQKIWVHINLGLKYSATPYNNELAQDLRVLLQDFIKSQNQSYHPLFKSQLEKAKTYLEQEQAKGQTKANPQILLQKKAISMMKLGYILACITLNLQTNGLCVKDQQQNNEESGSQQIGDGVGIGEGQAHDAAQNVGDQIQFEEQIMGNKDEEKNQDKNADNKEENDIEMENDFDGDMYSKEEQPQGESGEEGKSQEADQKMGEVDQKQKEKDMKNEAGEAEGSQEAQVDVKDQKEGEQQLIDNERENKQQRRGEDKRQMEQEEEQQKSDWDSNNQEGDKINKQKEDVQAPESEESFSVDMDKQPEKMDSEEQNDEGQENQQEGEQVDQNSKENQNGSEQQKMEEQGNEQMNGQIDEENLNQNDQEEEEKQEKQKKQTRQSKQYKPAYGRQDINTNNEVINEEEPPANEADQQGRQEQGQGQGNQGSGKPIHNLSAQFLQELLKQQKSEGNEKFIKDLNVIVNDEKQQGLKEGEQNAEQYEMTEQKDKFATNLPLVDDQKMKDEEEEIKQNKAQQSRNEQQVQKKQKKNSQKNQKQNTQKMQRQKQKLAANQKTNEKVPASAQKQQMSSASKELKKQSEFEREAIIIQEDKEILIRNAVSNIKKQAKSEQEKQNQKSQQILSEAFEVSKILQQQLKSVLQPLDNAEYKGDFKTGKKLNLKKIIPFIASNFRKDRIWLRRTQPCQRNYYIMIGLDDTKSMHYGNVGEQALKGLLAISLALEHLSIKTSICSIREEMMMLKKFEDPLQSQSILKSFQFQYESSNSHDLSMAAFMNSSIQQFKRVDESDVNVQVKKLCFIISDGKMNKKLVSPFIKDAKKEDITYIFIVVDSQQASILGIKSVEYVDGKMKMKSYMSDFPYEYFLIVNDVKELGEILAMTLLQFIQEKSS